MVPYYHEYYKDFIDKFNIRNGELSSQEKLNKSVNVLKKEVLDLYNRNEIVRGAYAQEWKTNLRYSEGELVSYEGVNYVVKENMVSENDVPGPVSPVWEKVERGDYTLEVDSTNYIHAVNGMPNYTPTEDYHPSTKKYVDDEISTIYVNNLKEDGLNFLTLNNNIEYFPTNDYHPATKKYVDASLSDLAAGGTMTVGLTENSLKLGGREAGKFLTLVKPDNEPNGYVGFGFLDNVTPTSTNTIDFMRTTANGLLPYKRYDVNTGDGSILGSEQWKFKAVYSVDTYTENITTNILVAENIIANNINFETVNYDTATFTDITSNNIITNNLTVDILTSNTINYTDIDNLEVHNIKSFTHKQTRSHTTVKYTSDLEYTASTVLQIGTTTEVTKYDGGILAGVVSTTAAQTLNNDLANSVELVLAGRALVKIQGSATIGQYINAYENGYGIASDTRNENTVGVCIKGGINLVEVKI